MAYDPFNFNPLDYYFCKEKFKSQLLFEEGIYSGNSFPLTNSQNNVLVYELFKHFELVPYEECQSQI